MGRLRQEDGGGNGGEMGGNGTAGHRDGAWPALPYEDWRATRETLHRYVQVVGKVRLALMPFRNHWWHVALYVDTRGLTTGPMPAGDRTVEITFDLLRHRLVVASDTGRRHSFPLLDGLAVADFYTHTMTALDELGARPAVRPAAFGIPPPALSEDTVHRSYDPAAVRRYWRALQQIERVMVEFAGRFAGKQSPTHLFWHSFDLALGRFSGRPAPPRPDADPVTAEAYAAEIISFGFWPGDEQVPAPTFYSYTAPEPAGLTEQPLLPAAAAWQPAGGTAHLDYEVVRTSPDPRGELVAFLQSAYEAGAGTAGWDLERLASSAGRQDARVSTDEPPASRARPAGRTEEERT